MSNTATATFLPAQVFFLNHINTQPSNYGATLNPGKRLSVVDFSGNLAFQGCDNGTVDFLSIQTPTLNGVIYTASTAETLGIVHAKEPNSTLVANTTYGFWLTQVNPYTCQTISQFIYYSTGTTNSLTTGSACTAWATQIANAGFFVTTSGANTQELTITAITGYPLLNISNKENLITGTSDTTGAVSSGISEGTNNTLGDMNYPNKVNGQGQPFSSYTGYISANAYDIYSFTCKDANGNGHLFYLLVNTGDTNYSSFTSTFLTLLELGSVTPNISLIRQVTAAESPSVAV